MYIHYLYNPNLSVQLVSSAEKEFKKIITESQSQNVTGDSAIKTLIEIQKKVFCDVALV